MLKLNLLSPSYFQRMLVRHADSAYDRWLVSHSNPVDMLAIELVRTTRRRKDQQLRVENRKEVRRSVQTKEDQARNAASERRHRVVKVGNRSLKALRCPVNRRSQAERALAVAVHRLKKTQEKYKK
jgi:hypothetical protein